jgi:hypothetical protein
VTDTLMASITGMLYYPDTTTPMNGTAKVEVVTSNGTMSNSLMHAILAGISARPIVGGVVDIELPTLPQTGITPAGAAYRMTITSKDGKTTLGPWTFTLPNDTTIDELNEVTDAPITPDLIAQAQAAATDALAAAAEAESWANQAEDTAATVPGVGSPQWLKDIGAQVGFNFTSVTAADPATGLPSAGAIVWPDGTAGAFTGTTDGINGYTGFTATYAGATTSTLTASGITYDATTGVPLGPTTLEVS